MIRIDGRFITRKKFGKTNGPIEPDLMVSGFRVWSIRSHNVNRFYPFRRETLSWFVSTLNFCHPSKRANCFVHATYLAGTSSFSKKSRSKGIRERKPAICLPKIWSTQNSERPKTQCPRRDNVWVAPKGNLPIKPFLQRAQVWRWSATCKIWWLIAFKRAVCSQRAGYEL